MSPPAGPIAEQLPSVRAWTYLTPLREGGSLPGLVEADDLGTHVVKFTGAGQGPRALVAEIIVGSLARLLDIPTPELKLIEVDDELGRRDPDEEVNDLITASPGTNLAIDFLPGSVGYERGMTMDTAAASRIVWLDALCANVDRSERNTNLLLWGGKVWAIDHGACLNFHHSWSRAGSYVRAPYRYDDHVLGDIGSARAVHEELAPRVTQAALDAITALVPDPWLAPDPTRPDESAPTAAGSARVAYRDTILARLEGAEGWLR